MASKFCDGPSFVIFDGMHIMDCNGVANIVGGSVIRHLVENEARLGDTQQARMDSINVQMRLLPSKIQGYIACHL